MSGIYGFFTKEKTDYSFFDGLAAWNSFYGDEGCVSETDVKSNKDIFFRVGISAERFKKCYESKKALFEDGPYISVSDALLFDRGSADEKMPEKSDEEFLFTKVKNKGCEGLKTINGDFSGVLYDLAANKLTLFRDHMGTRPLFYYVDGNFTCFSTDIRGITSIKSVDAATDEKWIYETVTGGSGINAEDTEYEKIKCVPPGGFVIIDLNREKFSIEKGKYWIPGQKKFRFKTNREYIDKHRELITDAIKIRLDSIDGNIGAELSGGLDSSVIDILINRLGRKCTFFSWTPDAEEVPIVENDERLLIKEICDAENIECHYGHLKLVFGPDSMIAKTCPLTVKEEDMGKGLRERYAFPAYISTLEICEVAQYMHSQNVEAIFTGHGGDEGVSHRCNVYELWYNHEYYHYFKTLWARTYKSKNRIKDTFKLFYDNQKKNRAFRKSAFASHTGIEALLSAEFRKKQAKRKQEPLSFSYNPKEYIRKGGSRDRLDVVAFYGAHNRVRYIAPFVDYRLIDYSLGIPRYMFVNGFQNRYIYRKAFESIMPKNLYKLQSKDEPSLKVYWANHSEEKKKKTEVTPEMRANILEYIENGKCREYFDLDLIRKWSAEGEESGIPDAAIMSIIGNIDATEKMVKTSREYVIK